MIDHKLIRKAIVNGLKNYLATPDRPCEVVRANQTGKIPPYPYVSYTVITPVVSNKKGWCVSEQGEYWKELKQIWSFTVQSDDNAESEQLAMMAYDWFSRLGNIYLSDCRIVAESVGSISKRDNLISIVYEYRNGLDVTFNLVHRITKNELSDEGVIETAHIQYIE